MQSERYRPNPDILKRTNTIDTVCLIGFSGSGKDYVLRKLEEYDPRFKKVVSYADRETREGEVHGVHYYFVEPTPENEAILAADLAAGNLVQHTFHPDGTQRWSRIEDWNEGGFSTLDTLPSAYYEMVENDIFNSIHGIMLVPSNVDFAVDTLLKRTSDKPYQQQLRLDEGINSLNIGLEQRLPTVVHFYDMPESACREIINIAQGGEQNPARLEYARELGHTAISGLMKHYRPLD